MNPSDYIACDIGNFTLRQSVVVRKDNHAEYLKCESIDKLPKMLYNISIENDINHIILSGHEEFSKKIGEEIREINIANFNKDNLEITYLP